MEAIYFHRLVFSFLGMVSEVICTFYFYNIFVKYL